MFLALHVQVQLLHSTLLEVEVLRLDGAGEGLDGRRRRIGPDDASTQILQEDALHAAVQSRVVKRAGIKGQ